MALNDNFINAIRNIVKSEQFYINEPMSKHTTFNIGGTADYLIFPANIEETVAVFNTIR